MGSFLKTSPPPKTHQSAFLGTGSDWIDLGAVGRIEIKRDSNAEDFDLEYNPRDPIRVVRSPWRLTVEMETVSDEWAERVWGFVVKPGEVSRYRTLDLHMLVAAGGETDPAHMKLQPYDWRALWRQMKAIVRYEWRKATGTLVHPWSRSLDVYGLLPEGPLEMPPLELTRESLKRSWPSSLRFRASRARMVYLERRD